MAADVGQASACAGLQSRWRDSYERCGRRAKAPPQAEACPTWTGGPTPARKCEVIPAPALSTRCHSSLALTIAILKRVILNTISLIQEPLMLQNRIARCSAWSVCVLVLTLGAPALLHSQVLSGVISGTVTDATQTVVPNAPVTVVNADTGVTQWRGATNESGVYRAH